MEKSKFLIIGAVIVAVLIGAAFYFVSVRDDGNFLAAVINANDINNVNDILDYDEEQIIDDTIGSTMDIIEHEDGVKFNGSFFGNEYHFTWDGDPSLDADIRNNIQLDYEFMFNGFTDENKNVNSNWTLGCKVTDLGDYYTMTDKVNVYSNYTGGNDRMKVDQIVTPGNGHEVVFVDDGNIDPLFYLYDATPDMESAEWYWNSLDNDVMSGYLALRRAVLQMVNNSELILNSNDYVILRSTIYYSFAQNILDGFGLKASAIGSDIQGNDPVTVFLKLDDPNAVDKDIAELSINHPYFTATIDFEKHFTDEIDIEDNGVEIDYVATDLFENLGPLFAQEVDITEMNDRVKQNPELVESWLLCEDLINQ